MEFVEPPEYMEAWMHVLFRPRLIYYCLELSRDRSRYLLTQFLRELSFWLADGQLLTMSSLGLFSACSHWWGAGERKEDFPFLIK